MTEIVSLIQNFGFPAAITLYVLTRLEGTVKQNTEAINALRIQIAQMKR